MRSKPNRFQDVQFSSIEEFLEYVPKNERVIVEALRQLIFIAFQGAMRSSPTMFLFTAGIQAFASYGLRQ